MNIHWNAVQCKKQFTTACYRVSMADTYTFSRPQQLHGIDHQKTNLECVKAYKLHCDKVHCTVGPLDDNN